VARLGLGLHPKSRVAFRGMNSACAARGQAQREVQGMNTDRSPDGRPRRPRPRYRTRFSRDQIQEIKTTAKLVLGIVASTLLVIGSYFWLAGVPSSADQPAPSRSDASTEVTAPEQTDGDAALAAQAQRSCDEGNKDACLSLPHQAQAPDGVSAPPAEQRKEPQQ